MNGLLSHTTTTIGITTQFAAFRSLDGTPNRFSFPIESHRSSIRSSRCYSTRKPRKLKKSEPESNSFYVVRKGDFVGLFSRFSDFEAHIGTSIYEEPVSVYRGYSLPSETVEYFLTHGLKGAPYVIRASDLIEGMFGPLVSCMVWKDPPLIKGTKSKRAIGVLGQDNVIDVEGATIENPGSAGAGAIMQSRKSRKSRNM